MPLTRSRAKRSTVPTPATSSDDLTPSNDSKPTDIDESLPEPSLTNKKRSVAKRTKVQLDEPSFEDEVTLRRPATKKRTLVATEDVVSDDKPMEPSLKPKVTSSKRTSSTKRSSSVKPISKSLASKSQVKVTESSKSNLATPSSLQFVRANNISIGPSITTFRSSDAVPRTVSPFNDIDVDVARRIWRYLDASTLSALYATFDFSIQRLLCTSHGIDHVTLLNDETTPMWQRRMFLKSIQNVGSLHLCGMKFTALEFVTILRNANPLKLDLGSCLLVGGDSNSAFAPLKDKQAALKYFTPSLLPDFAVLTPRLEYLGYDAHPIDICLPGPRSEDRIEFSVPPTLLGLRIDAMMQVTVLVESVQYLPKSLTSLQTGAHRVGISSNEIFPFLSHFPHLETFDGRFTLVTEGSTPVAWPKSLTDLSLGELVSSPVDLVRCLFSREIPLERLSLDLNPNSMEKNANRHLAFTPGDFLACLPPSLTYMKLILRPIYGINQHMFITSLPTQLRELWIEFRDYYPLLLASLSSLKCLETLTLVMETRFLVLLDGEEPAQDAIHSKILSLCFRSLPSTLKTLVLRSSSLKRNRADYDYPFEDLPAECIPDFPASLTALTLPSCDLKWAKEFRQRWPKTVLTLSLFVDVWTSPNGKDLQTEFPALWTSDVVTSTFERAVYDVYHRMNIYFTLDWSCTSEIRASKLLSFDYAAPPFQLGVEGPLNPMVFNTLRRLQKLVLRYNPGLQHTLNAKHFPPSLTHLQIINAHITTTQQQPLPRGLTYLSSNSTVGWDKGHLSLDLFPALVHLDTPLWTWKTTEYDQ